jgi:hypothetical protein
MEAKSSAIYMKIFGADGAKPRNKLSARSGAIPGGFTVRYCKIKPDGTVPESLPLSQQ